jgi:hypothetical protein
MKPCWKRTKLAVPLIAGLALTAVPAYADDDWRQVAVGTDNVVYVNFTPLSALEPSTYYVWKVWSHPFTLPFSNVSADSLETLVWVDCETKIYRDEEPPMYFLGAHAAGGGNPQSIIAQPGSVEMSINRAVCLWPPTQYPTVDHPLNAGPAYWRAHPTTTVGASRAATRRHPVVNIPPRRPH